MGFRKVYEVVGTVGDGFFLCVECATAEQLKESPVFLGDCEAEDYCDECLHEWINRTDPIDRGFAPPWVYLDGEGPDHG